MSTAILKSKRDASVPLSQNKHLLRWVEKMAEMTKPAQIHWVDGSEQENEDLCAQMVESGTFIKLNQDLWPGCYYSRSDPSDVARVEDRTFICSLSKDAAGPTNNWVNPFEMRRKLKGLFSGAMRGRTMYVLPFSMGPIGSPMAQLGVQVTESGHVVVQMRNNGRPHDVCAAIQHGHDRLADGSARRAADGLGLRSSQYAHHGADRAAGFP